MTVNVASAATARPPATILAPNGDSFCICFFNVDLMPDFSTILSTLRLTPSANGCIAFVPIRTPRPFDTKKPEGLCKTMPARKIADACLKDSLSSSFAALFFSASISFFKLGFDCAK